MVQATTVNIFKEHDESMARMSYTLFADFCIDSVVLYAVQAVQLLPMRVAKGQYKTMSQLLQWIDQ